MEEMTGEALICWGKLESSVGDVDFIRQELCQSLTIKDLMLT